MTAPEAFFVLTDPTPNVTSRRLEGHEALPDLHELALRLLLGKCRFESTVESVRKIHVYGCSGCVVES